MHSEAEHNLVLGTAQLGMRYGIANRTGQPDQNMANDIIDTAAHHGILEYDTAQGYGTSEQVLGNAFEALGIKSKVNVISKLDPKADHNSAEEIESAIKKSIHRLGVQQLHGIMIHDERYLERWDQGVGRSLQRAVEKGLTKNIGISVYDPVNARKALMTNGISLIQIPSNIADRRFEKASIFTMAVELDKQVYVRSVFLQGLILMDLNSLPGHMQHAMPLIRKMDDLVHRFGKSKAEIALGYAKNAYPHAKIIIGIETEEQVNSNIMAWHQATPKDLGPTVVEELNDLPDSILNPAKWPQISLNLRH